MFIFRILTRWKATYSHRSISHYELCTKTFRVFGGLLSCIELKWRQNPYFRRVKISNMPIRNTGIYILVHIYVSDFILNLSFIYWFNEFNRVVDSNEGETHIFERSSIHIWQIEIPVSILKFTFQNSVLFLSYIFSFCEFNRVAKWKKANPSFK